MIRVHTTGGTVTDSTMTADEWAQASDTARWVALPPSGTLVQVALVDSVTSYDQAAPPDEGPVPPSALAAAAGPQ